MMILLCRILGGSTSGAIFSSDNIQAGTVTAILEPRERTFLRMEPNQKSELKDTGTG